MSRTRDETEQIRRRCDKMAAGYDSSIAFFERLLFEGGREWVCSGAAGDTLEFAIGTARNLPFYPATFAWSALS